VRNVCMAFDLDLHGHQFDKPLFSATIWASNTVTTVGINFRSDPSSGLSTNFVVTAVPMFMKFYNKMILDHSTAMSQWLERSLEKSALTNLLF
jgi:hypothetical protein